MACLGVGAAPGLVSISARPRALKGRRHPASKLYRPGNCLRSRPPPTRTCWSWRVRRALEIQLIATVRVEPAPAAFVVNDELDIGAHRQRKYGNACGLNVA